jgi:hypothetical protein
MWEDGRVGQGLYISVDSSSAAQWGRELPHCMPGEPVIFKVEADESLRVLSCRGAEIGEIAEADKEPISSSLAAGRRIVARVNSVHGHNRGVRTLVLRVDEYDEGAHASVRTKSRSRVSLGVQQLMRIVGKRKQP